MHPEVRQDHPGSCPKCGMALEPVAPIQAVSKTEYVCPMHPQIVRSEPGNCPICGMTLEPRVVSAGDEPSPELADMTRRFWISVALTVPLMLIEMSGMMAGRGVVPAAARTWIELALATPVVLWAGWPLLVRGWESIVNRSLNMFTLIGMGVGVAYGYSLFAAIFPNLFPDSFRAARWDGAGLLRGGRRHHGARAARAGARASRSKQHQQCDQGAAGTGAQDGARHQARRPRRRRHARPRRPWRSLARAAGRESAGRRRGGRGREHGRRIDGDGRADSGREETGRPRDWCDDQRHRRIYHAGGASRQRHSAGARSCAW